MIDQFTVIHSDIDADYVEIGPFVYIGKSVTLGKHVKIHPHVTIGDGVTIGDQVEIFPGAYIGKPPKGPALGSHTTYKEDLTIGNGCVIGPNVILYYGTHVGAMTLLSDGVSIRENVNIGAYCIIGRQVTINYAAEIADHVKIMDLSHITAHTWIKKNVFIGPGVMTADDNRFGKDPDESEALIGGAVIGENANLGIGVCLLPCVKIGRNAVVGAGAVVTKDVADNACVMGIPARER